LQLQLRNRTRRRRGHERVEAIEQAKRAAHAQEAREVRGHLARLEPLHRAFGHARLLGQGGLRQVAFKTRRGEPLAQLAENRLVGESLRDLSNTSIVTS